jgi:hypothetical protein
VLVAHDVVVPDQGQLRKDLLPGHRAPTGDAEAEPAAQPLPVPWGSNRTPDIVRDDFSVLGVRGRCAAEASRSFYIESQVDEVGRVS